MVKKSTSEDGEMFDVVHHLLSGEMHRIKALHYIFLTKSSTDPLGLFDVQAVFLFHAMNPFSVTFSGLQAHKDDV